MELYEKRITAAILLALMAGCSQRKEISGEAFHWREGNLLLKREAGPVPVAGIRIYFLTASEHEKYESLLKEWRLKEDPDFANYDPNKKIVFSTTGQNSLIKLYRKQFPNDQQTDTDLLMDVGRRYPELLDKFPDAKREHEEILANWKQSRLRDLASAIDLTDDRFLFLQKVQSTTTDSNGKLKVILSLNKPVWVLAEGVRDWYFRYVPDGTPLVLSDGNAGNYSHQ